MLFRSYCMGFKLYLLYGVLVLIEQLLKGSKGIFFFACVGLWKEPIRWSRSKDAFENSSSRHDAPIDSWRSCTWIAHRCTRTTVRSEVVEWRHCLNAIGVLEHSMLIDPLGVDDV